MVCAFNSSHNWPTFSRAISSTTTPYGEYIHSTQTFSSFNKRRYSFMRRNVRRLTREVHGGAKPPVAPAPGTPQGGEAPAAPASAAASAPASASATISSCEQLKLEPTRYAFQRVFVSMRKNGEGGRERRREKVRVFLKQRRNRTVLSLAGFSFLPPEIHFLSFPAIMGREPCFVLCDTDE